MALAIRKEVLFRDLGGESVLLHLGSGQYYGLDEVGTLIWTLVAGGCSIPEIEKRILDEYDGNPDQVRHDVHRMLEELRGRDLLEFRDEETG